MDYDLDPGLNSVTTVEKIAHSWLPVISCIVIDIILLYLSRYWSWRSFEQLKSPVQFDRSRMTLVHWSFHSNYVRVLCLFRYIARYWSDITNFSCSPVFT